MIRIFINIIRAFINRCGVIVFKRDSNVYIPDGEIYSIVFKLIGKNDPVIIDGGAHLGDMPLQIRAMSNDAKFYCFEPDPVASAILKSKFNLFPQVQVISAALGDVVGTAQLKINASRPCNSLLNTSKLIPQSLINLFETVEELEVELTTIDDYCHYNQIEQIDCIKLDLQGYDYLALRGADKTLINTKVVIVEVWFKELYLGAHNFSDILAFMTVKGFVLYTLCGIHYGEANELIWADAIFVKSGA
jgi:FkbM family methyltransferase